MIVLFNPRSSPSGKPTLPVSLLSLAAVIDGTHPWMLVDGNLDPDPAATIIEIVRSARDGTPPVLAVTVMPGPQVREAVAACRRVRAAAPHVTIVWGGYVPSLHTDVVLAAPYVDLVIRSQGERAFGMLIDCLASGGDPGGVPNLSWTRGGQVVHNAVSPPAPLDDLPSLPCDRVEMPRYIHATHLGRRTAPHNSSFGCAFACNFCGVVPMSRQRWVAQSPARVEREVSRLVGSYGVDAVHMIDMDFFISEARAAEIADRLAPLGIQWWAMGRIDLLVHYDDRTWRALRRSGLRMIFSGAESGSDETLARMNKGGRARVDLALDLAARARAHGIVPELSFVVGTPPDPMTDTRATFDLIRRIKRVNPETEVILYVYTPVPLPGSLYAAAQDAGFAWPQSLDEWASDSWGSTALRRGAGLPWIGEDVRRATRDFERVLNARYPTVTDAGLTRARRFVLRTAGAWRYRLGWYGGSWELRALQRLMRYQRPETAGF
jgi:radical SAM superfamily enzyme YgiQ (UPF0313 family)